MPNREEAKPTVLGLIPARGGSKGIPRKNLVTVGNKPLIAWTVDAAIKSEAIDRIVLSTEDQEIAEVGRRLNLEVPFLRPCELAEDDTPAIDVALHAVNWLESHQRYRPDFVLLLQPTSPLRSSVDIRLSIDLAVARQANSVVSLCPVHQHPSWMKTLDTEGRVHDLGNHATIPTRRQDLPATFALNGAIYLTLREWLLDRRSFTGEGTYGYVMPPERSLDIDTPWDLEVADLILREF